MYFFYYNRRWGHSTGCISSTTIGDGEHSTGCISSTTIGDGEHSTGCISAGLDGQNFQTFNFRLTNKTCSDLLMELPMM